MPTIADIRTQYPQYDDMSDEDLAHGMHAKFYADMPWEQFAGKIGMSGAGRGHSSLTEADVQRERDIGQSMQQVEMQAAPARMLVRALGQAAANGVGGLANLGERAVGDDTPESKNALRRWMGEGAGMSQTDAMREMGGAMLESAAPVLNNSATRAVGGLARTVGRAVDKIPGGNMVAGTGMDIIDALPVVSAGLRAPGAVADAASAVTTTFNPAERATRTARTIAKEAAGENLPSIHAAMQNAPSSLNAGQAAAGINQDQWQALTEFARRNDTKSGFRMQDDLQEAGREGVLATNTPNLSRAKAQRSAATKPLYDEAAEAEVIVGKEMAGLLGRMPKGIMSAAQEKARVAGKPFLAPDPKNPRMKPRITGEQLHFIKLALDDAANALPTASTADRSLAAEATALRQPFLDFVEDRIPSYAQARLQYAEHSKPVNQSQVMAELSKTLKNSSGGERAGPFANAVDKTPGAVLKRATGQSRFRDGELSSVLNPSQTSAVDQVLGELRRDEKLGHQASAGAGGLQRTLRKNQSTLAKFPQWINSSTVIYNKVANMADAATAERVVDKLAEAMKSGQDANALLNAMTAHERRALLKAIKGPSGLDRFADRIPAPAAAATLTPREE